MFIVCDPGCNWLGEFESLKKLVLECRKAGADGFKPQLWVADMLYQPTDPYYDIQRKCELTFNEVKAIFEYGKEVGIEVFFSVFDVERVRWCEEIGVKRYKVASRTVAHKDLNSQEVMREISRTGKPVIVSTGMGYNPTEVTKLFGARYKRLYCIPRYPASLEDLKLGEIKSADGYSNHIPDPLPCLVAAIWRGNKDFILETHVMLDESFRDKSPDGCCSITVNELAWLVESIRKVELMPR